MTKNVFKKTAIFLSLGSLLATSLPLSAMAANGEPQLSSAIGGVQYKQGNYYVTLDEKSKLYLKTLTESGVMKELSSDSNGQTSLAHTDDSYLKATYRVNDEFLGQLKAAISTLNNSQNQQISNSKNNALNQEISNSKNNGLNQQISNSNAISPNLYVSNSKLYFTNSDVRMYLFAAAAVGSGALAVALAGVGTLMGGPVGLFISTALVIIGLGTLTNLCYLIIQAVTLNQGVYIGINWNGPFPNYSQGTW
jgi:hypothetical protein